MRRSSGFGRGNSSRDAGRRGSDPKTYADDEIKAYGLNCCQAIFRRRPDDIIKVYLSADRRHVLEPLLQWCAQNRRAYKLVTEDELERITSTRHHEGVCCIVRLPRPVTAEHYLSLARGGHPSALLFMEDVRNPHNLGAILRVASHFGVRGILLGGEEGARLSGAAMRVAEGGAESVPVTEADTRLLLQLKDAGFKLIATSPHAKQMLYDSALPEKCIFMMGSEDRGLSPGMRRIVDFEMAIPGSGAVESLNVSTATAVILSEFYRSHSAGSSKRDRSETRPQKQHGGRPVGSDAARSGGNRRQRDRRRSPK